MHRRLILITGAPRTGTTVVGEYLSGCSGVGELYEPMNANVGDRAVQNQFEIVGAGGFSTEVASDLIERIRRGKLHTKSPQNANRNRFLNRTKRTALSARYWPFYRTLVWKDPFAIFLAPEVAARGDIPVIVTIRDPLSVTGSFKRMNWTAPIADLIARMEEAGLKPPEAARTLLAQEQTPARAGMILWHLVHAELLRWLDAGVPLTPILTTDILTQPERFTATIKQSTGLEIKAPPGPEVAPIPPNEDLPDKAHIKQRNLDNVSSYWKKVLTEDEAAECRALNDKQGATLAATIRNSDAQ